jgi:hypothetical protein
VVRRHLHCFSLLIAPPQRRCVCRRRRRHFSTPAQVPQECSAPRRLPRNVSFDAVTNSSRGSRNAGSRRNRSPRAHTSVPSLAHGELPPPLQWPSSK